MSVLAYVRLRTLISVRSLTRRPGRLLGALAAVALVVVALRWLVDGAATPGTVGGGAGTDPALLLGLVVLSAISLLLVTGPSSSRYPSRRADVAWVYPTPLSVRAVGLVEFGALAGRRLLLWGAGIGLLGVWEAASGSGQLQGQQFAGGTALLLTALSAVSVGASSTRAVRSVRLPVQGLGAVLAGAVLIPVLVPVLLRDSSFTSALSNLPAPARDVGALLLGEVTTSGLLVLVVVLTAGLGLVVEADSSLRERLVLDAELWAELQDEQQNMRSVLSPRRPPFRGLGTLRGPWALTWSDIAQLRHADYQRWSYFGLVAGAVLVGRLAPQLIPLLVLGGAVSVLVGAFTSGVALHLRLGTFDLVPGQLPARVVAAELLQVVNAVASTAIALAVACWASDRSELLPGLLLQALTLIAAAFAARTAAAAVGWREGRLRGRAFHLALGLAALLTIATSAVLPGVLVQLGVDLHVGRWCALLTELLLWVLAVYLFSRRSRLPAPVLHAPRVGARAG